MPAIDESKDCIACGLCVVSCPGQAIFLVDEEYEPGFASITMPYEFLPLPQKGDIGVALNRSGKEVCSAKVVNVKTVKVFDQTHLLTIKVPTEMAMKARFYRSLEVKV